MSRIGRLIPSGRLRRAVLVLAGGTAVAQLVVLAASPVISRLYSPEEFGVASAAIGLVALVISATCLNYDDAVPIPEAKERAVALVVLAAIVVLGTSLVTAIVLFFAGERILDAINAGELAPYMWLLVGIQFAAGLVLAFGGYAIREREFPAIAASRVTQSLSLVVGQLGTGFAGAGSVGLVIGDLFGHVGAALQLLRKLRWPRGAKVPRTSFVELRSVARRYRQFPLLGTPSALLNSVAIEAPLLIVTALYGARIGGLFALASRLLAAPAALVVVSISQVFVAEAAEQARADPIGLRPLFRTAIRKLFAIAAPLIIVLGVVGAFLVGPVFGDRWAEAGALLLILTPFYLAQIVTSPLGGALDVLERQDLLLVRTIAQVALLAIAAYAGQALGLSALWAIALISGAGVLSYVIYGAISWHAVRLAAGGLRAT